MKSIRYAIVLIIALTTNIQAADNTTIDEDYVRTHYTKKEVMIEMRDGVKLFTSIYEPIDKSVKHPILMNRTPYSCMPYGQEKFARLHRPGLIPYIKNNYIIVFQDVRGKNMSEGTFEDIRPYIEHKTTNQDVDEASDTYDTTDWLIHNTNNNGSVGVFGISYPGFYSTMAGICGHPAIKAVSPQAPVTDWFRGDDMHHNGALCLIDCFSFEYWFQYVNKPDFWNGVPDTTRVNPTHIVVRDAYTDYLKMGPVKNFLSLLGDSVKNWVDMREHPDLDNWWEERNVLYHLKDVKPAVMVVGGLFDAEDCYGAWNTYKYIKKFSPKTDLYLVEGPWSHGAWSYDEEKYLGNVYFGDSSAVDYYVNNIEYPFFAYYLEGKGDKPKYEARVFQTGENKWLKLEQGWDTDTTNLTAIYLSNNGELSSTPSDGIVAKYISDPSHPVPYMGGNPQDSRQTEYMDADQRFAESRTDVATFSTDVLKEPLRLDGPIVVDLETSITTTDADYIVKLIDVFPENFSYTDSIQKQLGRKYLMSGYEMLVRGDVMRGKYRESFSSPQPFEPNAKTKVRFQLCDVAHTFLPGHRLMVQVQSSWFPLIDRNPQTFCNIYTCGEEMFTKSEITLYGDSRILLPIKK